MNAADGHLAQAIAVFGVIMAWLGYSAVGFGLFGLAVLMIAFHDR